MLLILLSSTYFTMAQDIEYIDPNWNIPSDLCPIDMKCSKYIEISPDYTLYYLAVDLKKLAVIPPDGSSATVYDLSSIYEGLRNVNLGLAVFDDTVFMYQFNGYGLQIDIFQLDLHTGDISKWEMAETMPLTICNTGLVAHKPFFVLDSQRGVFCSEHSPSNFSIHIINIDTNLSE